MVSICSNKWCATANAKYFIMQLFFEPKYLITADKTHYKEQKKN
jgi:hypothetical protein